MEVDGRILEQSTPKFSKMVSSKYSDLGSRKVQKDLLENHGRQVSRCYIQDISQQVGRQVQAAENQWTYALPDSVAQQTALVAFGRDGTTLYLTKDGYRETMSGTIALYDNKGQRLHTIYVAQSPEYGKATFDQRFQGEIDQIKAALPEALYVGLADGAPDNWTFLSPRVQVHILDFYHASEYLPLVSKAVSTSRYEQKQWLEKARSQLKNETGGAEQLLEKMKSLRRKKISNAVRENLEKSVTYFENHHHQMDYATYLEKGYPIGSGVTEAACKVIVKERLCLSGMKWKLPGAQAVLDIRSLHHTQGRWRQFWNFVDRRGIAA